MPRLGRLLGRLVPLAAALAFITMAATGATQAAAVHPGDCGAYKYWHNGHCVDARAKPGKDWTAGVYL
jgi:hypothetical protein